MNHIIKSPLYTLGYNFIKPEFLPEGKDEYYLRNQQATRERKYRHLTPDELVVLIGNRNSSDNWNNILVNDIFNPDLIQNCKFYGLVRIGILEPCLLEFSELKVPVGLYNSLIISCDFGDNVAVDNVTYISHYIIEDEVIIMNVSELLTTPYAKFGNGIVKEGEPESVRIRLELCNENAGRSVLPFNGMLPGDAWLWSKYRDNEELMERFRQFTEQLNDRRRGYYGTVGSRTVIKNCLIIKDVRIGSDAYLKGANKIKNVTINSSAKAKSQIGEGCEIVNGIIGFGCRVFYGVKAVRFVMADQSQLKYGARLINSYLGSNATISCCEVLNSLIFPGHEQHHNNSFLCAALIMGQSNIAAGATIGSNHNSRSPDGELIAGRGFWPGLCVSLRHNSKFASFTILAKGDFPAELNITMPFSLVSNDVARDQLVVMPGYWFMYNMYALARNTWKYIDRDKRINKVQCIEYQFLAPDTVNELFEAIALLERFTGLAYQQQSPVSANGDDAAHAGRQLLMSRKTIVKELEVLAQGFENSKRKVVIVKPLEAYHLFRELVLFYAVTSIVNRIEREGIMAFDEFNERLPDTYERMPWINTGGQLMPQKGVQQLIDGVTDGSVSGWDEIHHFYEEQGRQYENEKLSHALSCLEEITGNNPKTFSRQDWILLFRQAVVTKEWMVKNISESRAKDYTNPFRTMVYDNLEEMNKVMGKLADNSFIQQEQNTLQVFREKINRVAGVFTEALQPV